MLSPDHQGYNPNVQERIGGHYAVWHESARSPSDGQIPNLTPCIKHGDYLIFEIYSGVGGNWVKLQKAGAIQNDLKGEWHLIRACSKSIIH